MDFHMEYVQMKIISNIKEKQTNKQTKQQQPWCDYIRSRPSGRGVIWSCITVMSSGSRWAEKELLSPLPCRVIKTLSNNNKQRTNKQQAWRDDTLHHRAGGYSTTALKRSIGHAFKQPINKQHKHANNKQKMTKQQTRQQLITAGRWGGIMSLLWRGAALWDELRKHRAPLFLSEVWKYFHNNNKKN